jgi:hypothetical protein
MVHKVFSCEIAMTSPYIKIHQKAQGHQDVVGLWYWNPIILLQDHEGL